VAAAAPKASTNLGRVSASVSPAHYPPFDRTETAGSDGGSGGRNVEIGQDPDAGDTGGTSPETAGDLDVRTAGIRQLLDSAFERPHTLPSWRPGGFPRISFWWQHRSSSIVAGCGNAQPGAWSGAQQ